MTDQARVAAKFWIVPAELKEIRVDAFARRCLPHLSRRALEQAMADRLFTVNGKIAQKGSRLRAGDALAFKGADFWLAEQPPPAADRVVPIVYEDAFLLAVNKPAGIATHGFSGRDRSTLANVVAAMRPELCDVGKSRWEPGLVHRLDRDTSGVLLIAKTQAAFAALRGQFRRRQITKRYLALVWGKTDAAGTISWPLAHDPHDRRRMRALQDVKPSSRGPKRWPAVTRFRKLAAAQPVTLLEVEMETGVTHQIRAHLAALGHPLVADALYGRAGAVNFGLGRHFLHAWSLTFGHPGHGERMRVQAELPDDLRRLLKQLRIKI